MHEFAITDSILQIATGQAAQHGASRLTAITLVVGQLTGYVPDSIQFYFDILSQGALGEGAELIIKRTPGQARCRACQVVYQVEPGMLWTCPGCGALDAEVISGRELLVESIEIEEAAAPPPGEASRSEHETFRR